MIVELSEQAKRLKSARFAGASRTSKDELLDELVVRVPDLHLEPMYRRDAAVAVRDLRANEKRRPSHSPRPWLPAD